jgi:hypothetical protein
VSGEQTGPELALEIKALVEWELARAGTRRVLHIDGDSLVLRSGGAETRAEIRGTLAQWESLPDDLRERRIRQIAELLAAGNALPAVRPVQAARHVRATRASLGLRWYSGFAPVALVALTSGAIALAYHYLAPQGGAFSLFGSTPSSSGSGALTKPVDPDRERFALATSACDHTRTRVAQGANIGPADSEGWVVELALLRRGPAVDLSRVPGLSRFISRRSGERSGTVSWAPATHLAAVRRFDAEVMVEQSAPLGDGRISGVSLVFSGPYVLPYFTEDQRSDYLRLADALAEELEATDGALFARCANGQSHYIGSWFLGASPGGAVASLVYFMASYSDVPLLKPNVLGGLSGPPEHGHAFDAIGSAAARMDRNAAATLVGRELGMVSGGRDHTAHLTFPFRDANRSTRASVGAARALQLANSG